jgi:hypothetical protein
MTLASYLLVLSSTVKEDIELLNVAAPKIELHLIFVRLVYLLLTGV